MPAQVPRSMPPDHDPTRQSPVRVVLVGQTGLDLPLRLDPAIELRRVPTAVHAIGEAAEPIGLPGEGGVEGVTVILSPECDPALESAEFLSNLQLVRPGARVLRLVAGDDLSAGGAGDAAAYDGTIRVGTSAEEIRRMVRDVHQKQASPPRMVPESPVVVSVTPAVPVAPVIVTVPSAVEPKERAIADAAPAAGPVAPREAQEAEPGETTLVQSLLHGRDVLLPAMELIRRRTGRTDVAFIEGATVGAVGPGVPVAWQGATYGRLASPGLPETVLVAQAAWLAQWLALRQQQAELREAAFTDDLTGAWNRRYCERFLGTAIAQSAANRTSVTVLFFDIDNFKQYNDRYGHAAGDDILCETVRLLRSVIRPSDCVCRIGGDEFLVIFYEPTGPREAGSRPPASISDIATRFQRQICEHRFPKLAEKAPGTLTVSGGLATFPWDGRTTQELIERADQLAIQSKLQGKNAIKLGPGAMRVCGRTEQVD